ncbi:hypothetical protein RMR21_005065 [Agrobacterium sp. rho-8.1]|nr:hypothetical protein [Agrobacterium sp. rho-8.1]
MFGGAGMGALSIFFLVGMWMLHMLAVAHIGWIVKFSMEILKLAEPTWKKLARICAVIVTPIVGFYADEAVRHYRTPPAERPRLEKRRLILPAIALCLHIYFTVILSMRPDVAGQGIIGIVTTFLMIWGYYLAFFLPHHILARVVTISKHGPITTYVHWLPLAMIAILAILL